MNFGVLLFCLTIFTGIFYILDRRIFAPKREKAARAAAQTFESANREAIDRGVKVVIDERNALYKKRMAQPWWLEYTAGLFPVIAIVFLFRSFLFEPFRIPSGSMLPTLEAGDFILVNKYEYGLRLPVTNHVFLPVGSPQRGDVVVFHYPRDPSIDYIKRVVGVPGDTIEYFNKVLYVNGVEQKQTAPKDYLDEASGVMLNERTENLGGREHRMALDGRRPSWVPVELVSKENNNCVYGSDGFVCKVPEGQYFVLGDNRDNSEDSRYWGFVPDRNLVGRAVLIWANFGDFSRVGTFE